MSFTIYPAIDIRGGKCVRLLQGDYDKETVYAEEPVEVAHAWAKQGAEWVHVVDLDGAKAGRPVNADLIGCIAAECGVPTQVGGGLRTRDDVDRLLGLGVARVILGTAAIEDRAFVADVLRDYADRVAVGIDARGGYVATRGWLETSAVKAEDLAVELAALGARTFIFTDISRDGMLGGPNIAAIVRIAEVSGQQVIASGGVSSLEDLVALAQHQAAGVCGAIVGQALYTHRISLADAIIRTRAEEAGRDQRR